MPRFEERLLDLEKILLEKNPDSFGLYQPALTNKEVELSFKEMSVTDTNLLAIYNWRDGIQKFESLNKEMIFEFGNLISIDRVKEMYSHFQIYSEFENKNVIPFIGNCAGDFLFFNNQNGNDYGKVLLYCVALLHIDKPIPIFDSLVSMIDFHICIYSEGIIRYDKEEGMIFSDDQYYDIGRKFNPNSRFWF